MKKNPHRDSLIQENVDKRCIQLANGWLKYCCWSEVIVFSFTIMILWPGKNHHLLLLWYIPVLTFCFVRYGGVLYYQYSKSHHNTKKWFNLIWISTLIEGLSWGPVGSILMPNPVMDPILVLSIILLMVAVINVTAVIYSPLKNIYLLILIPAYLPHIIWLFYMGGIYRWVSFMATVYFFLLISLSSYIHKYISSTIRLQLENMDLIQGLTDTKQELESSNQNLQEDITRREMEQVCLQSLVRPNRFTVEVFKEVLQHICKTFHWRMGVIWYFSSDQEKIHREAIWSHDPETLEKYLTYIPENTQLAKKHFFAREILKNPRKSIIEIQNITQNEYKDFSQQLGIQFGFGFPIFIDKEIVAFLDFAGGHKSLKDEDLKSILSISHQLGLYLKQKQTEAKEEALNKQLISTARQVGMSDIAVSILHNIGNLLNSVNVTVNILLEKLQRSKLLNVFIEINQQLKTHAHDLERYLTEGQNRKILLKYFDLLEHAIHDERAEIVNDLKSLHDNLQHIKDIVVMQNAFSTVVGMIEPISLEEQLEETIKMIGFNESYTIERNYEKFDTILLLDKIKFLKILANLIRNAKDAIIESKTEVKKLKLSVRKKADHFIEIKVIDNGIGIPPKNLTRIFSFGFTTKRGGHGFGLHNSILLAKELGGTLSVTSEGLYKGSIFTLKFPCQLQENKDKHAYNSNIDC